MKPNLLEPSANEVHHGKSLQLALAIFEKSMTEIAEQMGVTKQAVQTATGTKKMNPERVKKFADAFNFTVEEFEGLALYPVYSAMFHHCSMAIGVLQKIHKDKQDKIADILATMTGALIMIKHLEEN